MNPHANAARHWDTSSTSDSADSAPMEMCILREQLDGCRELRGRLFASQCNAQRLHRFLLAHLVSTLVLAALLMVFAILVF